MTNPMTDEERERLMMNDELHDILRAVILVTSGVFLVVFLLLVVFVDDGDARGCKWHPEECATTTTTEPTTTTTTEEATTTTVVLIPPVVISREIVRPTPVVSEPEFTG